MNKQDDDFYSKVLKAYEERQRIAESIAKDYALQIVNTNDAKKRNDAELEAKLYLREYNTWKQAIATLAYVANNKDVQKAGLK